MGLNGLCEKLDKAFFRQNCTRYSRNVDEKIVCATCSQGYYNDGGVCKNAVSQVIPYCLISEILFEKFAPNIPVIVCVICEEGYKTSILMDKCVPKKKISKCIAYTTETCIQ